MVKKFTNGISKNLRWFLATALTVLTVTTFTGCSGITGEGAKANSTTLFHSPAANQAIASEIEEQEAILPSLSVAVVDDYSLSYKNQIEVMEEKLLRPCYTYFKKREGSEQLMLTSVTANSNVLLTRYLSIAHKPDTTQPVGHVNHWIESEKVKPAYTIADVNRAIDGINEENWLGFTKQAFAKHTGELATKSDVANAIDRAVLALSEIKSSSKFLIVSTDFEDDFKRRFTTIPDDIKILVVGTNIKFNLDEILGTTNYERFESIEGAIRSITSSK